MLLLAIKIRRAIMRKEGIEEVKTSRQIELKAEAAFRDPGREATFRRRCSDSNNQSTAAANSARNKKKTSRRGQEDRRDGRREREGAPGMPHAPTTS